MTYVVVTTLFFVLLCEADGASTTSSKSVFAVLFDYNYRLQNKLRKDVFFMTFLVINTSWHLEHAALKVF